MKKKEIQKISRDIHRINQLCRCMDFFKKLGIIFTVLTVMLALKDALPVITQIKSKKQLAEFLSDFFKE